LSAFFFMAVKNAPKLRRISMMLLASKFNGFYLELKKVMRNQCNWLDFKLLHFCLHKKQNIKAQTYS
jgi:hypothetical protein